MANRRAKFKRDGAFQFDREIGNATAGVELEWRSDGGCWAGGNAAGAGAATVFLGRIRFEFDGGDDFGEENPIAELAADEVGVFADEAETGALGEIAFEQRPGVDIPQGARVFAGELVDEVGQLLQAFGEDIVVILETGITGNGRNGELRMTNGAMSLPFIKVITDGQRDDAFRARQNLLRVHAFVGVALEVIHLAVLILGEPALKFGGVIGWRGRGKMAIVKAQFPRALTDGCFHRFAAWAR